MRLKSCVGQQAAQQHSAMTSSTPLLRFHANPASGSMWTAALCVLFVLASPGTPAADEPGRTTQRNGGGAQCGEYTNQVMEGGMCRLVATLPQLDEQRCPDMFRCTDEVSYWLHENEDRKKQVAALTETVAQLQEERRNHRHRIKALELQVGGARAGHYGPGAPGRWGEGGALRPWSSRISQRVWATWGSGRTAPAAGQRLARARPNQLHNLTVLLEEVQRSPGCMINIVRPNPLMNAQEALHPEVQHMRSCPIDCASIYYNGVRRSGLYTVVPAHGGMPVEVYCGGWTVIQRRMDGTVSFDRSWREYRAGFGDLNTEFWLGNDHIHHLSTQGEYSLRIDLEDWSNKHKHALYQSFSWYHDKQGFSTPDSGNICAEISHGGWWYNQCFYANLNGVYYRVST
ncbi:hypothetical protein CRUP_027126 [Coryphaenoides rupestris]|nr:hypothetical protein CRUP_027126 [Coryphaenoides rupestris]